MNKNILTILTIIIVLPMISVSLLAIEPYVNEYSANIYFADSGDNQIGSYTSLGIPESGNVFSLPIDTYTLYENINLYVNNSKFSNSCQEVIDRTRLSRERYFYEEDLGTTKSPYSQTIYPSSYNDLGNECQLQFPQLGTFNGIPYYFSDDLSTPTTGDSFIEGKDRLDIVYYVQVLQ